MGDIINVAFGDDAKRRVVFEFDECSLSTLEEIRVKSGAKDLGAALTLSLRIYEALQSHYRQGFTELHSRDPATGDTNQVFYRTPVAA